MIATPCPEMPRSYAEAKRFYEGRRRQHDTFRSLRNNTEVRIINRLGEPAYAVKLHATDIIIYYPDGRVFLDSYDSKITNSRRDDAAVPTIRSASAMGIPKRDRLEYEYRWDIRQTGKFPYGLPALDLLLGPDGFVEEIDGKPIDQFVEHVRVPIPEAQARQKKVLGRARQILTPWCRAQDAMDAPVHAFECDFSDFDALVSDVDSGMDADARVAEFIQQFAYTMDVWALRKSHQTMDFLRAAIAKEQPANQKHDRTLWKWAPVRPADLAEVLA